jgi:hypothetical protein
MKRLLALRRKSKLVIVSGWLLILVSFLGLNLESVPAESGPELPSVPAIKCPLYVMEYHVWYRSPFGNGPLPGYVHWGDTEHIDSELPQDQNIRDMGAVGYPLLGLYDSDNLDVIRWQLRCAHRAGIDGLFVQLFPDRVTGTYLGGSRIFASMLKIAAEEHIQIACHDEVMFRSKWKAQQPDVMAVRIGNFIKQYGSDPAYLKIDGHPVYSFQYWNKFIPSDQMAACLDQAEHLAGMPIHFLILGGADQLYQRSSPSSFVVMGNSFFIKPFTPSDTGQPSNVPTTADWLRLGTQALGLTIQQASHSNDKFGLWGYPGFNNNPQSLTLRNHASSFYRDNGDSLAHLLTIYNQIHPDFIILSSWNDWMENTAMEPGYRFDNPDKKPAQDPYLYCRMLARAKGLTFVPPPLPPKEAVDPLRWQSLYGIDATPPLLKSTSYSKDKNQLDAVWTDSGSGVVSSVATHETDAGVDFLNNTAQHIKTNIDPERIVTGTGFLLTPKSPLVLQLDGLPTQGALPGWYVALQFQGQLPAQITIKYTADPTGIDYREFDSVTFPAAVNMTAGDSDTTSTKVALLRCASFAPEKKPTLTISLASIEKPPDPNATVYLRRLYLFHTLNNRVEGTCLNPGPEPEKETKFHFQLADRSSLIFLLARDAKDNWSAPKVVTLDP